MSNVKHCPKCGAEHNRKASYCLTCHARYTRAWRRLHQVMSDEAKKKDAARSYAGVYKRRGKLKVKPCEVCGDAAQMHHDDYDKPLEVRWLCRPHHLALHAAND